MPCNRGLNNDFIFNFALVDGSLVDQQGEIDGNDSRLFTGPTCLCPIPNTQYFYLRCHPREEVGGFHLSPNRDLLVSSYRWEYCFLLRDVLRASVSVDQFCWFLSEVSRHDLKVIKANVNHLRFDVAFWGLASHNHGNSIRQSVSFESLLTLFGQIKSAENLASERYDFIGIKLVNDYLLRDTLAFAGPLVESSGLSSSSRNTFCIFADSLDLSCVDDPSVAPYLRGIPKLLSRSTHFSNFTSSGDWTYPCLDALHSGFPPHRTLSAYRSDPYMHFMGPSLLYEMLYEKGNYTIENLYSIFNYSRGGVPFPCLAKFISHETRDSHSYLTSVLRANGINVASIKAAQNHSWRYGWNGATSYSVENSSLLSSSCNLRNLFRLVPPESGNNCYFVDMDLMHGGLFLPGSDIDLPRDLLADDLDWLDGYESSRQNFLGTVSTNARLKRNYLAKLLLFDRHLDDLLSLMPENSNIVLWSDHGSNFYPHPFGHGLDELLPDDSGAKLEKIWKPALLVSSQGSFSSSRGASSDELVSTSDLYSIVLHLCGINQKYHTGGSILPVSLGGGYSRSVALTFGVAYQKDSTGGKKTAVRPERWDLVARFSHSRGELFSTQNYPCQVNVPINDFLALEFPRLCSEYPREML